MVSKQAREAAAKASIPKDAETTAQKAARKTVEHEIDRQTQISKNKGFAQQQTDYDIRYNTQAAIAQKAGSGRYEQGNKVVTLRPDTNGGLTKTRNAQGGWDYTQRLEDTAYFSDQIIADKVAYIRSENPKQTGSRIQNIGGQNEYVDFIRSDDPEALAINEYFNQYKSTERPSKTVLTGYLEERGFGVEGKPLSEKATKYIDFISGNWGNTSIDFGSSTYYDPKTQQKFSAKTGEGDLALAKKLGFSVSPQPPSVSAGNNKPDVDALNKFFSSYKSTTQPPKTILEGYLADRKIPISDEGRKYIDDVTGNRGTSFDKGTYQNLGSTYFDPQSNKTYNAKTGEGDRILGYRVTGEKPSKPTPDPLGISGGLQSALAFAENKSVASKQILDSNADFRTKAKAGIEQTKMEIGKYFTSIPASFVNLGGNIASYQKGSKSSEQIKVPDTAESMFISNVIETKGKNIGGSLNVASKAYAQKYGTIGLIGSAIGSAVSIYTLKGASPIKYSKYIIPTAEKEIVASRQLSLVAGKKSKTFVGKYDKGDFFIGKPKAAKSQYEKYDIPASRGVEPSQFKPTQYEIYKSHQPYLIENKILNPNVQTSGLIEKNLAAQKGISYTYQSEIPKGSLGDKIPVQDQAKIYGAISDVQKKGYVQGIKGGFVESSLVEPRKSKYVEQGIFQTKQKLSPEYSSQALQQVGKYPVKQFPVKDIDIEEKYLGSGYKAAAEIRKTKLSSGELSSGQGSMNISYIQKGERSPLINIVGIEEKPTEAASMSQYSSGKVFGSKYPTQKIKIKIPSSDVESTARRGAKTVDMYSMKHQVHGLTASTTALQSEKSLKEAGKSPQQIKSILGGYKITQYPAGMREKDIVGMYGSMIKTGRHQLQAGDKSKAISTFKGALEYKKTYEGLFDWNKEAKRFNKESSVISFASGKQGNIGGGSYGKGSVLATQSNSVLYPRNQKQKSYSAKSYSAKSYITPKSYGSYLSPKSNKSALSYGSYLSPKSNKSVKSFGSFGSSKSVKSIGSNKSILSIKSLGSLGSYGSPKSKGSPKSYSSIYSSKSKGSPKSYGSPKSFGSFGKSFYSTGGKPTTKVPLVPKILPILRKGNLPNRRSYPKREKPTQTFRWAVNNPFSKAFSIKEGKRGRRIEPF